MVGPGEAGDGYAGRVGDSQADRLFVEPGLEWRPVSRELLTERRLFLLPALLVGLGLVGLGVALSRGADAAAWPLVVIGAAVLGGVGVAWFAVIPRLVSTWRFAEREQDLLVSRGRLNRRLTVVPYGRMQVIEVTANPVSGRLGIATVTLVTASASTDAKIPGLPVAVAHELRDRLAAKGEALTAGL